MKMEPKRLNKIGEVLKERGIKNQWLADKLGMTKASVSNYVTNKHQPSLETLYQIATLLDIPVTELLNPDLKVFEKGNTKE